MRCHLQLSAPGQIRISCTGSRLRAALALGAALLAFAGCRLRDDRAPFTDSRPPPGLQARFYPPEGWGWGLVQVGDTPPARYGVSAPPRRPRADVVILPGYGEPAEVWFETARALNARGHVVWVLEPVGQGGSGRYAMPRDLGHADSLQPDVANLQAFVRSFVRRRPLVLIASREAAPQALAALRSGLTVDGAILTSPVLAPAPTAADPLEALARLGAWGGRAPGARPRRREGPDDLALGLTHDRRRGALRLSWQTANPDLRMGGPSRAWRAAFAESVRRAALPSPSRVPLLVVAPDGAATPLCRRRPDCRLLTIAGAGAALQLERDDLRSPWLAAVSAFVDQRIAGFAAPAAEATLAPEG